VDAKNAAAIERIKTKLAELHIQDGGLAIMMIPAILSSELES
jgi:hypothetical protein